MKKIHVGAVIFDYGHVLCLPQPGADRVAMAAILEMPQAAFDAGYWRFRLEYDAASLDARSYWGKVARRRLADDVVARLNEIDGRSWTHREPVMTEWAGSLRSAGLRIGLLSNMPQPVLEHLNHAGWLPEFDFRTFSCDVRMAKPSRGIYEHCLHGLGVAAADALFLDDRPENVRGAEALGMHTVHFTTPAALAETLTSRFDTPSALIATLKRGDEKNH